MRRSHLAISFVSLLFAMSILPLIKDVESSNDRWTLHEDPRSREAVEWRVESNITLSTYLNESRKIDVRFDDRNGTLSKNSDPFDPYFEHNSTIRHAIDVSPQWLNDTLSWRFHDLFPNTAMRWADVLTNGSIDGRYMDEIAFVVAYLDPADLRSWFMVPELMIENVRMIYEVASEVNYAGVKDTVSADGNHSTIEYRTPSGIITLPEEIYYWYLVMPKNEWEKPAYINTSTFQETNDPDEGHFWRDYLYRANDTGYPVLRDLLLNETTLWNGTRNQISGNGAVGAVTRWESSVMEFRYEENMRRDRQPVSLYKQHFGLCGENAQVLVAAAKLALIPTIVTINIDAMHAWNEFFERGWHQWEGYSQQIDNPGAEGGPGTIAAPTNLRMDSSVFTNVRIYTPTSNLTVRVQDRNGAPVDGAMVKIRSQPSSNHYGTYPLVGNGTDVNGEATFEVGSGFGYFVQILSPIDGWLEETDPIPLAFPDTAPGQNQTINITLNTTMPLKANLTRLYEDPGYGTRFNVTGRSITSRTRFFRDPWGYFDHVERDRPWAGRAVVLFLDDHNLSLYEKGEEFFPAGIINVTSGSSHSIILREGENWNIIVPGMASPLSRSFVSLDIEVSRSVVNPVVSIISPEPGTYPVGEIIDFAGALEPHPTYIGDVDYSWTLRATGEIISTSSNFRSVLPWGINYIEFRAENESGTIGNDTVRIVIEHPNRPPEAVVEGLANGSVLEFGTRVVLSAENSSDPDNDTLEFVWKDLVTGYLLSEGPRVNRTFTEGLHEVEVNVSDGMGGYDQEMVTFTILSPNLPPVPHIRSPSPWSMFDEGDTVHLSAEGTYDLEDDPLTFSWFSSLDGNVSSKKEDHIQPSPGYHRLTLVVSDGKLKANTSVSFHVIEKKDEPDRPPVANINSPERSAIYHVHDMILFSAEGSFDPDGGNISMEWTVDGESVSSLLEFRLELPEGIHRVTLDVFDGNLSDSINITVVVVDRYPSIFITVNGSHIEDTDMIICTEGENMTFDASGSEDPDGTGLSFEWILNSEQQGDGSVLIWSFEHGYHSLTLRVTDEDGKTSKRSLGIDARTKIDNKDDSPEDDETSGGRKETISPLLYIIPLIVILISIILISYSFSRWRRMGYLEE